MTFLHSYVYHRKDRALEWEAALNAIEALTQTDLEEAFGPDDISMIGELYCTNESDDGESENDAPGYDLLAVKADLKAALGLIEASDQVNQYCMTLHVGEYLVTFAGDPDDSNPDESVAQLDLLKLFPKVCLALGLEVGNGS